MNSVRIPVTLSPHSIKGNPRGCYVLAQRLFKKGNPHLSRKQYIGYNKDGLIITVGYESKIINLFGMTIYNPILNDEEVTWLSECSLFPMNMGFRAYIPGTILKPSAELKRIETVGVFKQDPISQTFYLVIGRITAEVLLGRVSI